MCKFFVFFHCPLRQIPRFPATLTQLLSAVAARAKAVCLFSTKRVKILLSFKAGNVCQVNVKKDTNYKPALPSKKG